MPGYARFFREPSNSTHRQYEALRAYFVDGLASREATSRFRYTPASFRVLCHEFRGIHPLRRCGTASRVAPSHPGAVASPGARRTGRSSAIRPRREAR